MEQLSIFEENGKESVASRKLVAAEQRRARKAARDTRSRLLSDSSDEVPKGILKNHSRIPTKRSVSECVDDLSQIMADLNLNIHDLPNASGNFCHPPCHYHFNEEEEDEDEEEDGDEENSENRKSNLHHHHLSDDDDDDEEEEEENTFRKKNGEGDRKRCDCNKTYGDELDKNGKPKKTVRFDERVYETVFFASRLYDKRYFSKYHFSSRHHPPSNQQNNKSNKRARQRSKSEGSDETGTNIGHLKADNTSYGCKQSKSQRARQSKKDKKKRLNRKEDSNETSSDDQGYCSSLHSFSD